MCAVSDDAGAAESVSEKNQKTALLLQADLLDCWGIGPSKVQLEPEPGFGHEMLVELARDDCVDKLNASREYGGAVDSRVKVEEQ